MLKSRSMSRKEETKSKAPNVEILKENGPKNSLEVVEKHIMLDDNSKPLIVDKIKAPPESVLSLRKEAMTTEELSQCLISPLLIKEMCNNSHEQSLVQSQSSVQSNDCNENREEKLIAMNERMLDMIKSRQSQSRQGRTQQRWEIDPVSNQRIRLVTGCVPILGDGKILLISANRKAEWILPKGGWECDETMGESAIREAFEEAGVLGFLGPELCSVQYETRKSKKRRQENEESQRMMNLTSENTGNDISKLPTPSHSSPSKNGNSESKAINAREKVKFTEAVTILSDAIVEKIRGSNMNRRADDVSSIASFASDSSALYSLVKLTLFPLYVTSIQEKWPESGRYRKCVDIDEAIKAVSTREEFISALLEVKKKQLHLLKKK